MCVCVCVCVRVRVRVYGNECRGKIEFLDSRLLSQALVALSKQHHSPDPTLCEALVLELSSRLPMFDDQDLTTTAHVSVDWQLHGSM